ncbi:Protein F25G6.9 [Aphelenchoides avenae]|nr:Protein F25G6.9 [Aphelenchus avenae]
MTLFSQSTGEERKRCVIRTLPKIAKNTVVTRQVLKLLYALSKSGLKDVVFEVAGDLWEANKWTLDETGNLESTFHELTQVLAEMQCLTNIDYRNDVEEVVRSKFSLLQRLCETEYGERFLSSIVEVVDAGEDWSLPYAIRCLASLCKQNLLEVGHTKSRMEKVVHQAKVADVLVAYCELLATSTVDNDDFNVALKCSEELWRLKDHEEDEVKVAAWKALAQFSLSHLTQRLLQSSADLAEEEQSKPIAGQQVCELLKDITGTSVLEGFGKFLHRMVACELEDLSRGFYHHESSRKDDGKSSEAEHSTADPVLAVLIPTLRGTLESVGNELHALALMEPLTKSVQPLTKKSSRCTQIYQSALLKALPPNDLACIPTLTYMAVWQTGTEAVINAMLVARRKQNPNYSITVVRDQIVDMMRSAMDQLTEATANVIAALPFLCRLVSDRLRHESSNTADTTHAHWQVSVLEYLLLHAIDDYQPRTLPLFQKEIARTPITRRLALLSAALILNHFTISFVEDMPGLVHIAVEYLKKTNNYAADAEWIAPMVGALLQPRIDTSQSVDDGLAKITRALVTGDDANVTDADFDLIRGRNTLNLLATILAVDATTVENIADEMRVDFSVEERILSMKQTEHTDLKVDEMFDLFGRLDGKQQDKLAYTFAKNVEKAMKSVNAAAAEAAKGLASYYVSHRSGTASAKLPVDYGQLHETSILRATVEQLKEAQDVNRLRVLLQSLVPQQRKDGRHLPPMDWTVVYNIPQLQEDVDSVKTMFYLALQQCHTKVVTKIVGRGLMDGHFLEAPMAPLIPKVAELLPQQSLRSFVLRVLADIENRDWPDTAMDTAVALARLAESQAEVFDAIKLTCTADQKLHLTTTSLLPPLW